MSEVKHITLSLIQERLSTALRRQRPDGVSVGGWIAEQADAIGCDADSFERWYYGKGTPSSENFVRLFHHFGLAFMADVTGLRFEGYEEACNQAAALLEQQAAQLRNGGGR